MTKLNHYGLILSLCILLSCCCACADTGSAIITSDPFDITTDTAAIIPSPRSAWPYGEVPQVKIFFLDIGQGEATFIQVKDGQTVLIDGGVGGCGQTVITPLLRELGVTTIDYIFITHPHADHHGGILNVLQNFEVKNFIDCGLPQTTRGYRDILRYLTEREEINYSFAEEGTLYSLDADAAVSLSVIQAWTTTGFTGTNNASTVLKLEFEQFSVLFTGDAEGQAEIRLCDVYAERIPARVLHVGHHGSKSSTRERFLQMVDPEYAMISCGRYNSYGHPHPTVVERLATAGVNIYRTDQHGTIIMVSDGASETVAHEQNFDIAQQQEVKRLDDEAWGMARSGSDTAMRRALELFREGIERDPTYPAFYSKLGYTYMELNELDAARDILLTGQSVAPQDFYINLNLIETYEKLGDREALIEQMRYFMKLNLPDWQRERYSRHFERVAQQLESLDTNDDGTTSED